MNAEGYACFDTALGLCGLAWSAHGIAAVQLPEANARALRAHFARAGVPEREPPEPARRAIDAIRALLQGKDGAAVDAIALDMRAIAPFARKVYEAARRIPAGRTVTYGELAATIDEPGAARAVGQALGHNPFAPVVPCHRVLAAGGRPGGFSAHGGVRTKRRLLEIEAALAGHAFELFG